MKVLVLADLHFCGKHDIIRARPHIRNILNDVDAVVICGDIFESNFLGNPYKQLTKIFDNDVPVICVLGNHEFFWRTVDETLDVYKNYYNPDKYNVHYLDIIGHYDIGIYRFFGNVLWYDGTMATMPNQILNHFANRKWMDCTIQNFSWASENVKCVNQIKENMGKDGQVNILCTHCVPHKDLNWHMKDIRSLFNAFSGMNTFLEEINPDYAFCGHTHRRIVGKYIGNCKCVNVGNDLQQYEYVIIDI